MRKILLLLLLTNFIVFVQAQTWSLTGNAGTTTTNFVGTTDQQPLRFKVNNSLAGFVNPLWGNTGFGLHALESNPYPSNSHLDPFLNTAIGCYALYTAGVGKGNTSVGAYAMYNNVSNNSAAVGTWSLYSNTSGSGNVGIGASALRFNTTGANNTAVGNSSFYGNTDASYNTAVGSNAGGSYANGWNNVFVGSNTRTNGAGYYNVIAIGQDVTITGSSQIRMGNPATISAGGWADWNNFSDGRFKSSVKSNVKGLDFIMKLNPVTYHLNATAIDDKLHEGVKRESNPYHEKALKEKESITETGFIAQEVEKAAKESDFDFSGVTRPQNANDFYGLKYGEFVVPLVKAVQEQQAIIVELKNQNNDLMKRLVDLERRVGTSTNDKLTVFPNPTSNSLSINISSVNSSRILIGLFDNKGSLVKQQTVNAVAGDNIVKMDISGLAKGIYVVSADWNGSKKTAQVVR